MSISVKPRVAIRVLPSASVETGQKIEISCHYTSVKRDIAEIHWYHNGKLLPNTSDKLVFDNAKPTHAGKYNCTATHIAGKAEAVVDITVNNCRYFFIY